MFLEILLSFVKDSSASILAICAIVLTVQQSLATRRHNRLSVRPMLSLFTHRQEYPNNLILESVLSNSGLGPAYIKSFDYLIDGVPIIATEPEQVYQKIQESTAIRIIDWKFAVLKPKHVMANDSSQQLVRLTLTFSEHITPEELDRYQVRVLYQSAYGETFTYDSREHDILT